MVGKLKALAGILGVLKVLSLFKWAPALGPVAGLASTVLSVFASIARGAVKGATVILTNPVTLVTVGLIAMVTFAVGVEMGSREGRVRVAELQQQKEQANAAAEERLRSALTARKAAEEAEEERAAVVAPMAPQSRPAPRPRPRPERVRDQPEPTLADRFCVPGFSSLQPWCPAS